MKQILKRTLSFVTSFVVAFSALMVWTPGRALAATRTWDGGGEDNKWSTAENWSGDTVPTNGDKIVFDVTGLTGDEVLENDIDSLSLSGIELAGTNASAYAYTIEGNGITLTGPIKGQDAVENISQLRLGIAITLGANIEISESTRNVIMESGSSFSLGIYSLTVSDNGDSSFYIANISGSGDIIVDGGRLIIAGTPSGYTGDVIVNDGYFELGSTNSLGPSATLTLSGESILDFWSDGTVNTPVTIGGSGRESFAAGPVASIRAEGMGIIDPIVFAGGFTLTSNIKVHTDVLIEVKEPFTSNGYTMTLTDTSNGSIKLPGQDVIEPTKETITIEASDKQPNKSVTVSKNKTYVIDGERGYVSVHDGGILKGNGKVQYLQVVEGARVAPGHSPGRLTVLEALTLQEGAVYEVEIKNKDDYDQLVVGENYSIGSNAIILNNATLEGIVLEGFSMNAGDEFIIINNLSNTDVSGTFKDLPEGATFKISDGVFKITYKGGDGNDVVLSVVTVPTVPSTGFRLMFANPAIMLAAAVGVAGAVFYLTRRFSLAKLGAKS